MIESCFVIQFYNLLSEECLDLIQVSVRFAQFLSSVAEDVLHFGNAVPHVDGERGTIFSAGQTQNVSCLFTHLCSVMVCQIARDAATRPILRSFAIIFFSSLSRAASSPSSLWEK